MHKHLVLTTKSEFEEIISGREIYLVRFFKKGFEFLNQLSSDDLVFLKKGKEVLGQFNVGRIIMIDGLETGDWGIFKEFLAVMGERDFAKKVDENRVMVIVQIEKLEQFITSPIDMPKGRKEWVILEN